jgi:hypothetical protein
MIYNALITTWQVDGGDVAMVDLIVDSKSPEASQPTKAFVAEELLDRILVAQRFITDSL